MKLIQPPTIIQDVITIGSYYNPETKQREPAHYRGRRNFSNVIIDFEKPVVLMKKIEKLDFGWIELYGVIPLNVLPSTREWEVECCIDYYEEKE